MADEATWGALFQQIPTLASAIANDIASGRVPNKVSGGLRQAAAGTAPAASTTTPPPLAGTVTFSSPPSTGGSQEAPITSPTTKSAPGVLTKWPILQDGDGGREVRALQVCKWGLRMCKAGGENFDQKIA